MRVMLARIAAAALLCLGAPANAVAGEDDLARKISARRIAVISDGDFDALSYATSRLAPRDAGFRDVLTVLTKVDGDIVRSSLPISNSVTAAPEILALGRDGNIAFVVEKLAERSGSATMIKDLAPGRRLFAVDLTDAAAPRLIDTATIAAFPESLAVSPDGDRIAVVSNTPEASSLQIVGFSEGGFGEVARFDLAAYGIKGRAEGPRGGVTVTNVQWHPSGRFLAVNVDTRNRVAFFALAEADGKPVLRPWGNVVEVGADPFVGRFTPDGGYYLTSNWGRDFTATSLGGRLPPKPSTISVVRLADPETPVAEARHKHLGETPTGESAEGLAISPDGSLVATVNMRGTAFLPDSERFQRTGSVTLLAFDAASGSLTRISDHPLEGALPEGGTFDPTGEHFLATVFQGHAGAAPESGAGIAVFRVVKGEPPSLEPLGRLPMPHGVHHVDVAR